MSFTSNSRCQPTKPFAAFGRLILERGCIRPRHTRKDQRMITRLLAPAVTVLSLASLTTSTPAVAQTAAQHVALASDSAFLQTAGSLGLLQVKLGKLAQQKGSSDLVRDFGKRMAAEYAATNEQLAAGAKQAAYPKPVLLRQHQQIFDRFQSLGRSSFDKSYMAEVVSEHDEAARLFEQEAKEGRVASLKQLAAGMVADIQQRQWLATQTASSVGADVTATKSAERQGS
jgi:putative membrane protein